MAVTAETGEPYRINNGVWLAPDGTSPSGGGGGGGGGTTFTVHTQPQSLPAPTGGAWASVPVFADAFNPANGLWSKWYPGATNPSTTPKLTAADSNNGASFAMANQVSTTSQGLALGATRLASPLTALGKTFNYATGGVHTFSDGRSGSIQFLMNPIAGKAWGICWEATMMPNLNTHGYYDGLDFGSWVFDANPATGIGTWSKLELDFIETFGWSPTWNAGPINVVDASTVTPYGIYAQNSGPSLAGLNLLRDGLRHRYEIMLDNVGNTQHFYIDGTLYFTFAYPSFVRANAANTMCGYALSNDMRNSDGPGNGGSSTSMNSGSPPATPVWTGVRTTYIHNVAIFCDSAQFGTSSYNLGTGSPSSALAPGTTLV